MKRDWERDYREVIQFSGGYTCRLNTAEHSEGIQHLRSTNEWREFASALASVDADLALANGGDTEASERARANRVLIATDLSAALFSVMQEWDRKRLAALEAEELAEGEIAEAK